MTWAQLGLHQKPMGLLNVAGYYDPLLEFFDQAVHEAFIKAEQRSIGLKASEPLALLDLTVNYQPQRIEKWIDRTVQT